MKKQILLVATLLAFSVRPTTVASEDKTDTALLDSFLRNRSSTFDAWDIGGQARVRYEVKENAGSIPNNDFIRNGVDNDNSYLLLREKVHLGYKQNWFSVFVEGRDSSTTGDDRNPNPESDRIDLHQAYVTVGNKESFPISLKVGRQTMSYGDERFIGASDWNNLMRVFDAAKLRFENGDFWVDGFAGRVVLPDDGSFNTVNDYDWFSGVYASTKTLVPKQETQLYFLSHNVAEESASITNSSGVGQEARDIYTIGMRVKSLPGEWSGWDYGAELAGQFGNYKSGGKRLDHQALTADVMGGYTWWETFGTPRFGFEYTYGSGDSDPTDNKHETVDLLFGTNHKLHGVMDLLGMRNLHSPSASLILKPWKNLSLKADYFLFWMVDTHDSLYPESSKSRDKNGYGKNPAFDDFVGSELDFVVNYSVKSWLNLQAGYGHFFVGDYIKQSVGSVSKNGGSQDADWVYLQTTFNF